MINHEDMETVAQEIVDTFEVFAPPVPIEIMLQHPRNQMWDEVDPTQLSGSFLSIKDRYSPRMSLTRLLVRHIATSVWGQKRNLHSLLADSNEILTFARMVIMPRDMINGLTLSQRNPDYVSSYFEVPRDDAEMRLSDLL
jgi:hypothetical protein